MWDFAMRVPTSRGIRAVLLVVVAPAGCDAADEPAGRTIGYAAPPDAGTPWFVERTIPAGLDFVHDNGATGTLQVPEIMGGGAALFDYDDDGDLDLYLIDGSRANRLFRNDGGPGGPRFVDVTEGSGLGDGGYGMGVAVGDIDNDGAPDVYVTNFGPDLLYRNLGAPGPPRFEDITAESGIDVDGWSCSAAFLDFDRDGDLDLYVTRYVEYDPQRTCFDHAGRPDYCGPRAFRPVHDVLLRNDGRPGAPRFTDVSAEGGMASVACAGLGVVCEDFDGDGWPDVYVANDAYPNQLWLNRGGSGTPGFIDVATELGVAYNMHGQTEASMGVVADDLDNDGRYDLFMTHLAAETNTLYRNDGFDDGFIDVSGASGVGASSLTLTGFGVCAFDVELDGDLDIAVANGRVNRLEPWPGSIADPPWDRLAEPNLMYVNDGTGRFRLLGSEARPLCAPAEVTRALAMGDLDDDGDVDLVVTNIQGPARLFANTAPRRGRWLSVRAVDPDLKRHAIGARVTVVAGGRTLTRTVRRAFSYLSSSDPRAHFGLGPADFVDSLAVRWPDGSRERFLVDCVDCLVEIRRGEGEGGEP